jgi:peptide/nickel transport system permease protein
MRRAVLLRVLGSVVGLFILSVVTFLMVRAIPGSVETVLLGTENVSAETRQAIRDRYRLDDPVPLQYATWVGGLVQGDFGRTVRTRQPVADALLEKLRPSLELALLALVVSVLVSIVLGTVAALRRGRAVDKGATTFALLGMSVPDFVAGLLLLVLVATRFAFFPVTGYRPMSAGLVEWFRHLALPAVALSLALSGFLTRITRASVVETLGEDFVRTARGKGLRRRTVLLRHVIRPSLIPVTTTAGLLFVAVIGGIVVIEQIFAIPGMGRLILDAIRSRDYALLQGATLFIGTLAILISLLVDLSYRVLDPRVRD